MALYLCLSVTSRSSIETDERIELVFGMGASFHLPYTNSWWRGTVVERRSLTGELSLSSARPAADG